MNTNNRSVGGNSASGGGMRPSTPVTYPVVNVPSAPPLNTKNVPVIPVSQNTANKVMNGTISRSELMNLLSKKANKGNTQKLGNAIKTLGNAVSELNKRGFVGTMGVSGGKLSSYTRGKASNAGEYFSALPTRAAQKIRNVGTAAQKTAINARNATVRGVRRTGHTLVPLTTFGSNSNYNARILNKASRAGAKLNNGRIVYLPIGTLKTQYPTAYDRLVKNTLGNNDTQPVNPQRILDLSAFLDRNAKKTGYIFNRKRFHL